MKSRPRYLRRLQLRSGGEVSLSIEAESGELSGPDASFVMSLIDALDRYQAAGREPEIKHGPGCFCAGCVEDRSYGKPKEAGDA